MAYLTKEQIKQAIQQHPEENPENLVQEFINQGHQIEGLNDEPQNSTATDLGIGFAKSAGRTVADMADLGNMAANAFNKIHPAARMLNEIPLVRETNIKVSELRNKGIGKIKEKLQPTNQTQKVGGYAETAAEVLIPASKIKKAADIKKVLQLSPEELKKVSGKALEYLSKKKIMQQPIEGGFIKSAKYKLPEQVEKLSKEFKHILSTDLNKTKENAIKAGKEYYDKTMELFDNHTQAINTKQLIAKFKEEIEKDTSQVYQSAFEKKDIMNKSIKAFTDKVKSGTNKGLEEARIAWRKELANADGKLSKANEKIHTVIKGVIKNTLPEEKKILYDAYKQKQAKLFDIQAIMDAKKAVKVGTSKIKEIAKKASIVGGTIVGYEGIKKLFK